ncbi:DoxX family protein [Sphingomonas bacterium]|uniref:DoxX family protein n=1 Tax=Sphingomonas bacterium TaxID=1895847 RepID=UPI0015755447|nr:DoxX family protein [Sphingomonas bacterium]
MLHVVASWTAAVAFLVAGAVNLRGSPAVRRDLVRWGYPAWWGGVTGGLEIGIAVLLCLPATRIAGLILGAIVIVVATLTVLRHRDVSHLMPLGTFAVLLGLAAALST